MCDEDGRTYGYDTFEADQEHHTLLGPDGEKLRYRRAYKIGFDLKPKPTGPQTQKARDNRQ